MNEFLYRFRSVKNLLGNGREPELSGSYIYFASPEELNDPQEGFRRIVWKGDEVLWRNLFKNYIECLFIRNAQYFTTTSLESVKFPVFPSYGSMPEYAIKKVKTILDEFINHPEISRHIKYLSSKHEGIQTVQLQVHLRSIQTFAMYVISKALVDFGLISEGFGINAAKPEELLHASDYILKIYECVNDTSIGAATHAEFLGMLESEDLAQNYERAKLGLSNNWQVLCVDSVEQFIETRSKLIAPAWYVACFMEKCDNSALWGHYGDNHKGVCLKFRTKQHNSKDTLALFRESKVNQVHDWCAIEIYNFNKVRYEGVFPEVDFFCSIGAYSAPELTSCWYTSPNGSLSNRAREVFDNTEWEQQRRAEIYKSRLVKTEHWIHEQEYRLIYEAPFNSSVDSGKRELRYNFAQLDGIIFGIKTPESDKIELIRVVEDMCNKRKRGDFIFYQSYYDTSLNKVCYKPTLKVNREGVVAYEVSETTI